MSILPQLEVVLAFAAILSGIFVITAKNPVISVLFLISVFINVAGYLVLIGVTYLGLVYIIVYVGAIAILFLFVVMMLNIRLVELLDTGKNYTQNIPLATILGTAFFVELFMPSLTTQNKTSVMESANVSGNNISYSLYDKINTLILSSPSHTGTTAHTNPVNVAFSSFTPDMSFTNYLQIESIGQGLYTYSTLWLIIASFILLLSMIGPIVLCMPNKNS